MDIQRDDDGVMGRSALPAAELASFRENGFLVIDRITSDHDVAFIRREVEALFARGAGYGEGALFDFAGTDADEANAKLPQLLGPHRYAPALLRSEFVRNAQAVARQILGPDVRLTQDHAIMKPPEIGGVTPWHQDEAFGDPALDYNEISFWLALQPVDDSNGCMRFVPGSHLWQVLPHAPADGDARVHALDCSGAFDPSLAVSCPLRQGGCTMHTTRTVHGAGPNHSAAPRWAYVVVFGVPPRPAAAARARPWLAHRDTARMRRRRAWLLRGGIFVAAWRKLRGRIGWV